MIVGINYGHTLSGPGSGATGYLNESIETRNVGKELRDIFIKNGHQVVNCTIDKAASQSAYLSQAVKLANNQKLDYFISIHFNAGGGKGVEVYTYGGRQFADALEVCANISKLGFVNRGVKSGTGLYVIRKSKAKSMLIEVCFVDTQSDAERYKAVGAKQIAQAIYDAVHDMNGTVSNNSTVSKGNSAINTVNNNSNSPKNQVVAAGQQHSINFTGSKITVDGIRGTNSKKNGIKCLQHAMNLDYGCKLKEDGEFGAKSEKALGSHYVKKGETQYMVTALEILLMLKGYNPNGVECPGIFGGGLEATVKQYQKDAGLKVDGVAGKNTFKSLIN